MGATMSDVQGVGSQAQRGLQTAEGLLRVVVERRVRRAVLHQTQETAGEHVSSDQVALIEQDRYRTSGVAGGYG